MFPRPAAGYISRSTEVHIDVHTTTSPNDTFLKPTSVYYSCPCDDKILCITN